MFHIVIGFNVVNVDKISKQNVLLHDTLLLLHIYFIIENLK